MTPLIRITGHATFAEQRYDKGYYLVTVENGYFHHTFRSTDPRPMHAVTIDLDGTSDAETALENVHRQLREALDTGQDERRPLVALKLVGRVAFHPFELGRERLFTVLEEVCRPLHAEIRNHLSLVTRSRDSRSAKKSLADIEMEVFMIWFAAQSI